MFRNIDENGVINHKRVTVDTGPGMTKQAHQNECDVNVIMAKFQKSGVVDFQKMRSAEYMEVSEIDFHSALNIIKNAETMFGDMPSEMRRKFDNDPGKFLEFVHNPENVDEMYKMGLAERPQGYVDPDVTPTPAPVPEVPPAE